VRYDEIEHRFSHHPPRGDQADRYEHLRREVRRLAHVINEFVPESVEKDRAFAALDDVMMRANAGIARRERWELRDRWVKVPTADARPLVGGGGNGREGRERSLDETPGRAMTADAVPTAELEKRRLDEALVGEAHARGTRVGD
jgi:hypothetical protein